MSRRLPKINKHIQRVFGEILLKEADLPVDVMVTVSMVNTAPNLKSAEIGLYVYPIERADEILKALNSQIYDLQGFLNRELDFRPLPRIRLRIDYGAQKSDNINQVLRKLKEKE
ncbi:MAG: ribosome-binding factor A [bacterium]|nr:ribosome-binding factor A [bacterium]MDZ4341859.1 ribosome-binding factor A [Candidatus Binatia bacterium]